MSDELAVTCSLQSVRGPRISPLKLSINSAQHAGKRLFTAITANESLAQSFHPASMRASRHRYWDDATFHTLSVFRWMPGHLLQWQPAILSTLSRVPFVYVLRFDGVDGRVIERETENSCV